uniref:Uncharacterized protein n=1 Tax=Zea mays TaxID=4577 RepID=B6T2H3_MAIZE|nr:hypothetical protein [Zea mays]
MCACSPVISFVVPRHMCISRRCIVMTILPFDFIGRTEVVVTDHRGGTVETGNPTL